MCDNQYRIINICHAFYSAELEGMARSLGIPKLFKTSVKDDLNVNCVFTFLSTAYVQSVLAQSTLEEEALLGINGHLDESDDIDLVLNHRLSSPLFGGGGKGHNNKNKSSNHNSVVISDNQNGKATKSNGLLGLNNPVSNKVKNGGKNFFKNPVILKSSTTNLNQHNNQNAPSNNNRGGGGFFFSSSNKKQNNNNQNSQSTPTHPHHYNFFKSSSTTNGNTKTKIPFPNGNNGMAVAIDGGGNNYSHHPRNGQLLQSYRHHNSNTYSHYVNGGGGGGGGVGTIGISVDPNRWSDTNVPFRLDLVNGKKRKKDPCTIL
jgi:hypothetical protein